MSIRAGSVESCGLILEEIATGLNICHSGAHVQTLESDPRVLVEIAQATEMQATRLARLDSLLEARLRGQHLLRTTLAPQAFRILPYRLICGGVAFHGEEGRVEGKVAMVQTTRVQIPIVHDRKIQFYKHSPFRININDTMGQKFAPGGFIHEARQAGGHFLVGHGAILNRRGESVSGELCNGLCPVAKHQGVLGGGRAVEVHGGGGGVGGEGEALQ